MAKKITFILNLTLFLFVSGCTRSVPELRIMTWTNYLIPQVIEEFENKEKVKVILDYFSSNEELLAKIQSSVASGGKGYDLIIPSDYMIQSMVRLKLLTPLDKSRLDILTDINPHFSNPEYDPNNVHSLPFAWGTTGIAANTKLLGDYKITSQFSWKEVFENPKFSQKVILLDDAREVFQAALLALGKRWTPQTGESELKEAFEYLKKNKKQIQSFIAQPRISIESNECIFCQDYSGDVHKISAKSPHIRYILPQEGATLWVDNFAIPVNSSNPQIAYIFLKHVLSKEGSVAFTQNTYFATTNLKAQKSLAVQIQNNEGIFPGDKLFKKLTYIPEKPELLTSG